MTVHELSLLVLEWIWARPKPLQLRTMRQEELSTRYRKPTSSGLHEEG
jgi:hypothetical protein